MVKMVEMSATGRIWGMVIFQSICHSLAESMRAASYMLGLIFCSPLMNSTTGIPVNQRMVESCRKTPESRFAKAGE